MSEIYRHNVCYLIRYDAGSVSPNATVSKLKSLAFVIRRLDWPRE